MSDDQAKKIKEIVDKQVDRMHALTDGTPYGSIEAVPDHDIFEDITKECKDSDFWLNFKEISPVLLCFATETNPSVSRERDLCVTGEILKTKSLLEAIQKRLNDNVEGLNLCDLAVAVKTLADKVDVITYLKEPDSDPVELRFNLNGTNKKVKVDIKKLQEAIKFVDADGSDHEEKKHDRIEVDISEEDSKYLDEKLKDFKIETARNGLIDKKCMMNLMKLIGDFSKSRSKDISKEAQNKRSEAYTGDDKDKYVDIILETMNREEESFNFCTAAVLSKLDLSQETYGRSEQALIMDPMCQMELLQKGIENEDTSVEVPKDLDKKRTIALLKESNDKSFEQYKDYKDAVQKKDPYLTPVVIS